MKGIRLASLMLASTLCLTSCKEETKKVVQPLKITFKKEGELRIHNVETDTIQASFNIEIADDEYQRQTGLMHRESMKDDQAMLFIFDDVDFRSFYMKNTYISLDIIYFDADGKLISVQSRTEPMSEASLPSKAPAKYVLEVNAGLTEKLNLLIGDRIEYNTTE